jgi:hypothetical protein
MDRRVKTGVTVEREATPRQTQAAQTFPSVTRRPM